MVNWSNFSKRVAKSFANTQNAAQQSQSVLLQQIAAMQAASQQQSAQMAGLAAVGSAIGVCGPMGGGGGAGGIGGYSPIGPHGSLAPMPPSHSHTVSHPSSAPNINPDANVRFKGAIVVFNVSGQPRFMNYMDYDVFVTRHTVRVLNREGQTVAMLSMSNIFGVFDSTNELIKAWAINQGVPHEVNDSSDTSEREDAVPNVS